jgi:ABC-type transporter Mla MlaB component
MTAESAIELDGGDCAVISGALTFDTAPGLYEDMAAHIPNGALPASLDLSEVTTVDSAGLALLLEWQAMRNQQGASLVITGAPSSLVSLAQLCEAIDLLNLSGRHE